VSQTDVDLFWMRRALAEAERGRGRVEPNPMVGAVVVREGRAVGVGHHQRFGGPHAEVNALAEAGDQARGAALYVTLEPCCHVGKTPPCADAVIAAGVRRVVAALRDPFPKVAGGGLARLRGAGVEAVVGVAADEARRLAGPFLKRVVTGRPYVIAKWAMTLDGKTATAAGDSVWISGERSRALVHERRGQCDAVVVGVGTALADDPSLTARPPGARTPARVVLDSAGRLPTAGRLATSARKAPVWVVVTARASATRRAALEALGCEVLGLPGEGHVPIGGLLDELGRRGCTNVLVEGGGRVLGSFFDAGEVDEVDAFVAPRVVGGPSTHGPAFGLGHSRMADAWTLSEVEVSTIGRDVRIQGHVAQPWRDVAAQETAGGSLELDPRGDGG